MTPSEEADLLAQRAGARLLDDVVVAAVGEDAREWLHGQLTVDLRERSDAVRYALVLAVKGKIVGDLHVVDRGPNDEGEERFDLLLPGSHADAILERLERFLVMEDVELERLPVRVLSIQGPAAEAAVPDGVASLAIDRLGHGGRELLVDAASADAQLAALDVPAVSEAGWELARIRAARPRMGVDFGDHTLPQEAGLKKRALAFDQGCYVGQEPVVMLEHRGKPPKRLVRLTFESGPAPSIGDSVTAADRDVGTITSAAANGEGALALALVKRKALEGEAPIEVGARRPSVDLVE
ncbi:MAG: folate-binding protein YgfZ [Deltaproteobacteria bacterium]|nr:folate-binding protein YgfZ [Deltaproteobacteria bacterium]